MHGFRLAEVHLGETVAVIGLGLLGLITVQLAKAAGCRVLGMELNPARAELARGLGCDVTAASASEMESLVAQYTAGIGADAVIITAATSSNEPVELAARIARGRATVVSVGAVGTEIPRKPYFEKNSTSLSRVPTVPAATTRLTKNRVTTIRWNLYAGQRTGTCQRSSICSYGNR
jgi:threonine dehydrogenase-like Zn-dependent dehydrogenase